MGKRKSRAKPAPKKRRISLTLCSAAPFVTMEPVLSAACNDMKNLIGEASCRICQESFSTVITALTEPIDIYSEWIDECERVNNLEKRTMGIRMKVMCLENGFQHLNGTSSSDGCFSTYQACNYVSFLGE
ncbi:hypothetical protein CXB51_013932 [Gossypium anomalum]|uniref:Transcription elongation factor 1 homolog n=1 Tax=Gossypium anomalum TaxID=47600 RepID=A0A8J5YYQ9_9ROSI|nr:hypothetical protein CXB51_013932 [Gossypium anomalum]